MRHLLEVALKNSSRNLEPVIESDSFDLLRHYAQYEHVVTFQIAVGLDEVQGSDGLVAIPLDLKDVPPGIMSIKPIEATDSTGRTAAKFANQLTEALEQS